MLGKQQHAITDLFALENKIGCLLTQIPHESEILRASVCFGEHLFRGTFRSKEGLGGPKAEGSTFSKYFDDYMAEYHVSVPIDFDEVQLGVLMDGT